MTINPTLFRSLDVWTISLVRIYLCLLVWTCVSLSAQTAPEICSPVLTVDGFRANQVLGYSVGTVGDLNGDGLDDFFVGSAGHLDNVMLWPLGQVCVYSGITGSEIRCWDGEQGYAGFGVTANAGDVNGDGTNDLIVSAAGFHGPAGWQAGRVYLFSGLSEELLHYWDGPTENQWFGASINGGFDIDGDGVPDVVVGETGVNSGEIEFPGQVYVFSGATKEVIRTWVGETPADHFGAHVAVLPDFDGDGRADILVGASWHTPGRAYIFSGSSGQQLWYREGDKIGGGVFGARVADAGDVNGDGMSDFLIGDYYHDGPTGPGTAHGQAYLFVSPHGDLLHTWTGEAWDDFFGFSVAGAGDVNGDDVPDVLLGAYSHDGPAGWNSGKAYVYSGVSGNLLWSATGEGGLDFFGKAVGTAGDINGDGRAEIVVGAYYHNGPAGFHSGRSYIYAPVPNDCNCTDGLGLADYSYLASCMSGPNSLQAIVNCLCADQDADEDVDISDFYVFQVTFIDSP